MLYGDISARLGPTGTTIDDFEDGDITVKASNWSGWSGDTGSFTVQQTTVINGQYSGSLVGNDNNVFVGATRDTADTPSEVTALIQGADRNGAPTDRSSVRIRNGTDIVAELGLMSDGDNVEVNFNQQSGSWSTSTAYLLRFSNIEFDNNQFNWEIVDTSDSSVLASGTDQGFYTAAPQADEVLVQSDANSTNPSGTVTTIVDDIQWGP